MVNIAIDGELNLTSPQRYTTMALISLTMVVQYIKEYKGSEEAC